MSFCLSSWPGISIIAYGSAAAQHLTCQDSGLNILLSVTQLCFAQNWLGTAQNWEGTRRSLWICIWIYLFLGQAQNLILRDRLVIARWHHKEL